MSGSSPLVFAVVPAYNHVAVYAAVVKPSQVIGLYWVHLASLQ